MKKVVFCLLALSFTVTAIYAQTADLKTATKALGKYKLDREKNASSIVDAMEAIMVAEKSEENTALGKFWLAKGNIFQELSRNEFFKMKYPEAAFSGYDAYKKALGMELKKFEKNEVLDGLLVVADPVNQAAVAYVDAKEYDKAYNALSTLLQIKKTLNDNEKIGVLDDPKQLQNIEFFTAYTALLSGNKEEAKSGFEAMLEKDIAKEEPDLYLNLFRLYVEEDEAKGLGYLTMGREIFPDNQSLLLNETQYFLDNGRLDEAEDRLQKAIEADPENKLLYTSLGKVYDDLYQQGGMENETLFDKAVGYYKEALRIDENHLGAVYNLGAMLFNKTTPIRKKMNELPLSATKEYDALKAERDAIFQEALPYFLTAYGIESKDINTLIALKEITAAMDDLEASGKYKKELEAVQAGN
ncbi:MAG: hypothetical protein AAF502_11465 [Bacteroidota bacterium]